MEEARSVSRAKIKFIENNEKKVIPIEDIVEFQENHPKDKSDFKKNKVYTCWYKDEKYPKLMKYGIQIGKLYEQGEDENKRVVFSKLQDSVIDSYYNDSSSESDEDAEKDAADEAVEKKRIKEIKRSTKIKETEDQQKMLKKKMETLISGTTLKMQSQTSDLKKSDILTANLNPEGLNKPTNVTDDNIVTELAIMDLKIQLSEMKKKYESLEVQHENLMRKCNEKNESDSTISVLKCNLSGMEKDYECLKKKYASLIEKYKEQKEYIASLHFHNEKLLSLVFPKNLKEDDPSKCKLFQSKGNISPPLSPIQSVNSFASGISFQSSPYKNTSKKAFDVKLTCETSSTLKKVDSPRHSFNDDILDDIQADSQPRSNTLRPSTSSVLQETPKTRKTKTKVNCENDEISTKKSKRFAQPFDDDIQLRDDTLSPSASPVLQNTPETGKTKFNVNSDDDKIPKKKTKLFVQPFDDDIQLRDDTPSPSASLVLQNTPETRKTKSNENSKDDEISNKKTKRFVQSFEDDIQLKDDTPSPSASSVLQRDTED